MPRTVGLHPETKEPIQVGIGRFGPYVRMGSVFGSLDRDDDVLALGLNRAVDLIARKMASVRTLGVHPKDKEFVAVRKGRFGPYVQHGQTVANLPRGTMMDDVTLDEAVVLLAEKGKTLKPRGAAAKKARGGRTARVGAKAEAMPEAAAKARSAPRKQPARPAPKAASAAPKKAAAKKKSAGKKAKTHAVR
jgi:DNA topoisomerase-1